MPKLFDHTDGIKGKQVGSVGKIHSLGCRHGVTANGLIIRTEASTNNMDIHGSRVNPRDFGVERVIFAQFNGYDANGEPTFQWSVLSTPDAITEEEKERSRALYSQTQNSYQPEESYA